MADIVYGTEKIRVIIWFEMRLEELMSVHRHLIFIGIQNTDPAVFIQSLDALKQCMRCQFIVMICKSDVIPRCDTLFNSSNVHQCYKYINSKRKMVLVSLMLFISYGFVVAQTAFFSREAGSRKKISLLLFET